MRLKKEGEHTKEADRVGGTDWPASHLLAHSLTRSRSRTLAAGVLEAAGRAVGARRAARLAQATLRVACVRAHACKGKQTGEKKRATKEKMKFFFLYK